MEKTSTKYFMRAVDRVLGHMASMSCRSTDSSEMPEMYHEALNVRIDYNGEHSGELGLVMTRSLAARIASRILGLENEGNVWDDMIEDTLFVVKKGSNIRSWVFLSIPISGT